MNTDKHLNMKEPSTGVVHLWNGSYCGIAAHEYTLCGLAYDEPASERGQKVMIPSKEPCNCPHCYRQAASLIPYLKKQFKRIDPNSLKEEDFYC